MASFFSYNTDVPNTQLVQNYNAYATRFGLPPSVLFPGSSDPDAFRFIEVAGLTDQTQITAINNLVVGLKGYGLWDKMVAIYPFVGGTAFSHKWNLKNSADTDAAYRITWTGAIQHDSTGIEFLGGYGDTKFAPFAALTNPLQSNHIMLYNNRATISGTWGLVTMGNTTYQDNGMSLSVEYNGNDGSYFNAYNTSNTRTTTGTIPNRRLGLFVATRTDTNQSGYYQRGGRTLNFSSTSSPTASPKTSTIWVGGENGNFSTQRGAMAFASLGTGLTQTDVDNYYTVVQAYQTTLGRQV